MADNRDVSAWGYAREALARLHWGDGLRREEMRNQSPALRGPFWEVLPPDFCFPNAASVISYLEQLAAEGPLDVAAFPPPSGYPDRSTTGLTFPGHDYPPSVGSGAGSGSTGSSAQTGAGKWGIDDRKRWT